MRSFLLILMFVPCTTFAQKVQSDLACTFTGTDFVYDCTVRLARGGKPLKDVRVSVGADMPSMPMAHNLRPVVAKPGGTPGEYTARLDLDMAGEWAIKLRLSGPVRDQLILLYEFDERGARPAKRR